MRSSRTRAFKLLTDLVAGGAALVILASPAFASPRHALRIHVDQPVILPDGQIAPPGLLTLSLERELNPVRGLHTLRAAGFVGEFAESRKVGNEMEGVEESFVLFHTTPGGELRLIGYAWSDGRKAHAYLFRTGTADGDFLAEMNGRAKASPAAGGAAAYGVVAVAAIGR